MKKRLLALATAAVMAVSLTGCGTGSSSDSDSAKTGKQEGQSAASGEESKKTVDGADAEPIKLIFCNGLSDQHPQSKTLVEFSEAFEKETNGRYVIENYWNNTLGDDDSLAEMCRSNTIQGFSGSIFGSLPNYVPEFGVFALPYLLRDYDEAYDYLHGSEMVAGMMDKLENEFNLHYVDTTLNGVRALTTKDKKITCPDDLKGMKIRSMSAPVWQDVISALGGTPVPIAYSEIYVSLQTGVVEGQDNGISNVYSSKFYEIQKYFMKTDHGLTLSSFCLNADIWRNMSPEDQETFNRLWHDICVVKNNEMMEKYYEEGFDAITKAGVTIVEQDEMDMDAFHASADKMIEEKYESDPVFGPVIEDIHRYFNR